VKRAGLVVNPTKVDDADALRAMIAEVSVEHGWDAPVLTLTTAEDPGLGQTRSLLVEGVDVVLVAGGDGTVRAVAHGLAGTGNLLARNLDLPMDRDAAVALAFDGAIRRFDLGRLGGEEGSAFAIMAGMGLDAAMMRDTPERLKGAVGWPAYLVGAVRSLRRGRVAVTLTLDDAAPVHRRVRTVLVGNVGRLQGGIELLPDARPDDGVLDVCVIAPRSLPDWAMVALKVVRGRHDRQRRVEWFRARTVTVQCDRPQPRQLDGEVVDDGARLDVEVLPGALSLCVPVE
jgi:diacylglycerol kinase (ATP)